MSTWNQINIGNGERVMRKLLILATSLLISVSANSFDVETKYNQSCKMCHSIGMAGAPKSFDAASWAPRLKTGMDTLVTSVIKGKGAMPPKGLCNDCSADQYKALITFMSKAK